MKNLQTNAENTWCRGCGNFGILKTVQNTLKKIETESNSLANFVMTTGIGCHGKIFDYLNLSGVYALHGRGVATAHGIKTAQPKLNVISFGGDGDSMGEGLAHTLFAAKRNSNITVLLHNNGNYGLTTGQYSPLSTAGHRGPSLPTGSFEKPFHPIGMLMEAGATFTARVYSAKIPHFEAVLKQAIEHKGFSFVEILQPCVSYNNTYQFYNKNVEIMDNEPTTYEEALSEAKKTEVIKLGIFYKKSEPTYQDFAALDLNQKKNLSQRKKMILDVIER